MGRIRNFKPELPSSESLGRVSRDARYLFHLLFTLADDAGRLRGAPQMLASSLYPYDEDVDAAAIAAWLDALETKALALQRYEHAGVRFIQILDFDETTRQPARSDWSQKIQHPSRSKLPPPPIPATASADALTRIHEASPILTNSHEAAGAPVDTPPVDSEDSGDLMRPPEPSPDLASTHEASRTLAPDHGPWTMDHGPGPDSPPTPLAGGGEASEPARKAAALERFMRADDGYPGVATMDRVKIAAAWEALTIEQAEWAANACALLRRDLAAAHFGRGKAPRNAHRWIAEQGFVSYPQAHPDAAAKREAERALSSRAPNEDPRWAVIAEALKQSIGADVFASWFSRMRLLAIADGIAVLVVATDLKKSWARGNYESQLLAAVQSCEAGVTRVEIITELEAARRGPSVTPYVPAPDALVAQIETLLADTKGGRREATAVAARWRDILADGDQLVALAGHALELRGINRLPGRSALEWVEQHARAIAAGETTLPLTLAGIKTEQLNKPRKRQA